MPNIIRHTAARLLTAAIAVACATPVFAQPFSTEELREIKTAHAAYREAWLTNDRASVLATLTEDVVLMPSGMAPVVGRAAAEAFWWPDDGSTSSVNAYESTIEDVRGDGDVAVVRASSTMTLTWEKDGNDSVLNNRSMSLSVLERDEEGRWRIAVRMWSRRTE